MNQFPSDAVRILASPGHPDASLRRLARAVVPSLADFCLIFLRDGPHVRCAASAHVSREGRDLLRRLNRVYRITTDDPVSTVALAIRLGRPQLRSGIASERHGTAPRPQVPTLHQRLGCRSALVVPVGAPPLVLGALSLCYSTSARRYAPHDVAAARRIAALIEAFLRERAASTPPVRRQVRLRARV